MRKHDKAKNEAPPFMIRALSLTPADDETLKGLSQEATDTLGRAISSSAVVRALLRLAAQQKLHPELINSVEAELNSGVRWGKKS